MTELETFRQNILKIPYVDNKCLKKTSWLDNSEFQTLYEAELFRFYQLLQDSESKNTLCSIIKQRTSGDTGYLIQANYREYEHPFVKVQPGDFVIDAGVGDGFTSVRFGFDAGDTGQVIGFEPDSENLKQSHIVVEEHELQNKIHLEPCGLWSSEGTLAFDGGLGGSSFVSEIQSTSGNCIIPVISLDRYYQNNKLQRCDLISMDVEGAEQEVLLGARQTILKFKPKLQVSIYHRPEDLFRIPLMIHEMVPEYKFYLGHHSASCIETDLYAVV